MEIKKIKNIKDLNKLNKETILESTNPNIVRKALETKKFKAITGIEDENVKDPMHYKQSNLNNIICRIAKKNRIGYAINIKNIIKAKNRVSLLAKITQNIKLCKKHNVKIYIVNNANKNPKDLEAFSRFLGIGAEIIKC